jgi:type IV pilus assembly protein PilW
VSEGKIGEEKMKVKSAFDKKGVTLIELLIGLVVCALMMHAIYRLFITQVKGYAVQDQVVEVQQNVRGTMEILLRDLRMAGCDDDTNPYRSPIIPIATPVADNSITVSYRYHDKSAALHQATVTYNLNGTNLQRVLTLDGVVNPPEVVLPNVNSLRFSYGIDADGDGAVDGNTYVNAAAVGTKKILSIRAQMTANPAPDNPDVQKEISPRMLSSIVTLRNLL